MLGKRRRQNDYDSIDKLIEDGLIVCPIPKRKHNIYLNINQNIMLGKRCRQNDYNEFSQAKAKNIQCNFVLCVDINESQQNIPNNLINNANSSSEEQQDDDSFVDAVYSAYYRKRISSCN